MSWPKCPPVTQEMAERIRTLVFATAEKYDIAACLITAHVRNPIADQARKEVQAILITDFKLRRFQVAEMFGRDLRRVRRSVLGV